MFKSTNWVKYLFAGSLLALAVAPAQAADLRFSADRQAVVNVGAGDNVNNLYAAGAQVVLNANPTKDAVAAGGMVDINGNTADDLIAVGGNVDVLGNVGGSARLAGGTVHVDSKVINEDLVIAGGTVYIGPDVEVKGDLLVAGGNIFVQGKIDGNIRATASSLTIDAKVGGNVDARLKKYLELDSNANINGALTYSAPSEAYRQPNAKVTGSVTYTPFAKGRFAVLAGFLTVAYLVKLLGELAVAFLLFAIFKRRFSDTLHSFKENNFWKNAGIGLLIAIATPVVSVLLLFTLIGYYAAIVLMVAYVFCMLLAWIAVASYFGSWLVAKVNREPLKVNYYTITLGILLTGIIKVIPLIGWIFALIILFAGLGVLARRLKSENIG